MQSRRKERNNNKTQTPTIKKTTIMKRYIIMFMAVAAILASCNSDDMHEADDMSVTTITFTMTGDFQLTAHDFTRSLEVDGKTMTDVWVFDYMGGILQRQVHQTSADADFGTPTLSLALGEHHIYFVASRGTGATLNTDAHTLTFTKVLDNFWKDYAITITGGTDSGSRAVVLDRIVTKLKVVFSDAIPTGSATFNVTPAAWHYGFDYMTGNPTAATASQNIAVNIPNTSIGVTGESVSIYGFSGTTEWTTDITINCKKNDDTVLGSATITSAPFVRNRVSEYTGPLFGDNGSMTLSLNATWNDSYQGSW
jgi:hypothetical protein